MNGVRGGQYFGRTTIFGVIFHAYVFDAYLVLTLFVWIRFREGTRSRFVSGAGFIYIYIYILYIYACVTGVGIMRGDERKKKKKATDQNRLGLSVRLKKETASSIGFRTGKTDLKRPDKATTNRLSVPSTIRYHKQSIGSVIIFFCRSSCNR